MKNVKFSVRKQTLHVKTRKEWNVELLNRPIDLKRMMMMIIYYHYEQIEYDLLITEY